MLLSNGLSNALIGNASKVRRGREHSSMPARMLVLDWSLLLLGMVVAAASECIMGLACRPGVVASAAAFVGQRSHQHSHQHSQERASRLRLYGRKKRPGGRSDGNGGCGSSNNSAGGGSRSADGSRPRPVILSTMGRATGGSSSSKSSPGNIASLLSRSDKYDVLRTIEGLPEWELAGPTLATAWDRCV